MKVIIGGLGCFGLYLAGLVIYSIAGGQDGILRVW